MPRRHPITEDEGEIIAEMRERGRSFDAIAKRIGCSFGSVSWYCLKNGIDPPKPRALRPDAYVKHPVVKRGAHEVRLFTPEEDEQLIALERQGLRKSAIARALKRRPNSVAGRLMTLARREERAEA